MVTPKRGNIIPTDEKPSYSSCALKKNVLVIFVRNENSITIFFSSVKLGTNQQQL
jgi:hypothetical protein